MSDNQQEENYQFRRFHYYTLKNKPEPPYGPNDKLGILYDEKKQLYYNIEYLDNDSNFMTYRFLNMRDIKRIFNSDYAIMKHFHYKEELTTRERKKLLNYIRFYALRLRKDIYRHVDLKIDNVDELLKELGKYKIDPI
jgi:hypothetical protein